MSKQVYVLDMSPNTKGSKPKLDEITYKVFNLINPAISTSSFFASERRNFDIGSYSNGVFRKNVMVREILTCCGRSFGSSGYLYFPDLNIIINKNYVHFIACHRNLVHKDTLEMLKKVNIPTDMDPMKMTLCREMIGSGAFGLLGMSC